MNCIVTAGATYESIDQVRRLTNFSTGRLGSDLAAFLTQAGHKVHLLLGETATVRPRSEVARLETFGTTESLRGSLYGLASSQVDGVFHVAAVSDFKPGKLWQREPGGALTELGGGKVSSRLGTLLLELVPTVKVIANLREWFPRACLVGWKYEVDGDQASVLDKATRQNREYRLNATVANGPAYGTGYGVLAAGGQLVHVEKAPELFSALEKLLKVRSS